ncbi:hypothetical protein [Thalassotalea maritima]|uniref:hypothetical protein n=1 Tax=Thalassotalea maritima TaxID=3242416 RepID=UPI0035275CAA
MSLYLKFITAAFQPRSFFVPMASVILGTGLADLVSLINGQLFISCFVLVALAQISLNLANNYQSAFIDTQRDHKFSAHVQRLQYKLLTLTYIVTGVFVTALIVCFVASRGLALLDGILVLLIALPLAITVRLKTLYTKQQLTPYAMVATIFYSLCYGLLPAISSFYLHTATVTVYSLVLAICCALLTTLPFLSEQALTIIKQTDNQTNDKPQLSENLKWQKLILITATICTAAAIYFLNIPLLAGIFILALPSLVATIATVEHLPDVDIARSQATKVAVTTFAFWVLFTVGMLL